MSLKLNLSDTSILFHLPLLHPDPKQARLNDTLIFLILNIRDACTRLEAQLEAVSNGHVALPAIGLITMNIWTVLDTFRRMEPVLKGLGANMSPILLNADAQQLQRDVKEVRDSFQHLDERLGDYYTQATVGTSVFGDFRWHYRPNLTDAPRAYLCLSGTIRNKIDMTDQPPLGSLPVTDGEAGIFDLSIIYLKRTVVNFKQKQFTYSLVNVSIDAIITILNKLVQASEKNVTLSIEKSKEHYGVENISGPGIPGFIMSTEIEKKP
jgi:hypothetical protein